MSFWKRLFTKGPSLADAPLPEFPFPLVAVAGNDGIAAWKKYQALWRAEGGSAVMLGDADEVARMAESVSAHPQSAAAILIAAEAMTAADFLEQRKRECGESGVEPDVDEWPAGRIAANELSMHRDLLGKEPKPVVYLARIPTTKAWEIPAHLKFGGWNECPAPEQHVSILRRWTEKHGLEIYAMTGDVLECTVTRPPSNRTDAMALAREQFLYCNDIVYQGTETFSLLAATLLHSKVWFFWWD